MKYVQFSIKKYLLREHVFDTRVIYMCKIANPNWIFLNFVFPKENRLKIVQTAVNRIFGMMKQYVRLIKFGAEADTETRKWYVSTICQLENTGLFRMRIVFKYLLYKSDTRLCVLARWIAYKRVSQKQTSQWYTSRYFFPLCYCNNWESFSFRAPITITKKRIKTESL